MATTVIDLPPRRETWSERWERYQMLAKHFWAREKARVKSDPLLLLIRDTYKAYLIRRSHYDPAKTKCPGCGNFGCEMRWANEMKWNNGDVGGVAFRCRSCKCIFGHVPIFAAKNWRMPEAESIAFLFDGKPVLSDKASEALQAFGAERQ